MPRATDVTYWGSPRGPGNRSSVSGLAGAPDARAAAVSTGVDVNWARRVADGVLIHAGSTIRHYELGGAETWQRGDLGINRIVGFVESASHAGLLVAISRKRSVLLIHAGTGQVAWRFDEPERRDLVGVGSVRIAETGGRTLLVVAPSYSTVLSCFDITRPESAEKFWEHDFGQTIDAGFGPVVIIADVLSTGTPQVVVSSRTGSSYEDTEDDLGTERIVLGRRDGKLYQAILDLADGRLVTDVAYRPDDGPYPCARPYGLFQASPGLRPDLVLVSCQVEEYVAITSSTHGLSRRWGWFIEKDWPVDEQELRPQTTSIADVMGDGRPRLVVGHWNGSTWATLVLDVIGEAATGARQVFEGRYFWGCADLDGDGIPELVTSLEHLRQPSGTTQVEVIDPRSGVVVGSFADARIVTTSDDELPSDRTFHAERRGAATVPLSTGGRQLVLMLPDGTTALWSPTEGSRPLWHRPLVRVDDRPGGVLITDVDGSVVALDGELRPVAVLEPAGRTPRCLLWKTGGSVALIAETSQGTVRGWSSRSQAMDPIWHVVGRHPTLHIDEDLVTRIATAEPTGSGSTVRVWKLGSDSPELAWEVALPTSVDALLAFGDTFTLFVAQRMGPHTTCAVTLDQHGHTLWKDPSHSAWASDPLAFRNEAGRWIFAYDDHGLMLIRDGATGELISSLDWTAAYSTPILASVDGRAILLRADGTHGVEAVELDGQQLWRRSYPVFDLHPGNAAIVEGDHESLLTFCRRDGTMDVVDLATGELRTSIPIGPQAERRPLVALGRHVLVGLCTGELKAIDPVAGTTSWIQQFACAVESIVAVSGSGSTDIAVGTADGRIHVLTIEERQ